MASIRSRHTNIELAARRLLYAAGFRYRLHDKRLPGRPDIVISRFGVAIFVHGCFWHGHDCKRGKLPSTNTEFWKIKIDRNRQRDRENTDQLLRLGWQPVVIWQCKLKDGVQNLVLQLRTLSDQEGANLEATTSAASSRNADKASTPSVRPGTKAKAPKPGSKSVKARQR